MTPGLPSCEPAFPRIRQGCAGVGRPGGPAREEGGQRRARPARAEGESTLEGGTTEEGESAGPEFRPCLRAPGPPLSDPLGKPRHRLSQGAPGVSTLRRSQVKACEERPVRGQALGIGVKRKGPGIPEGLSARCPDSFAGWIQLDHREGPRSHEINRGVEITFNLCRQQDRDHSPSQPGASLNPRACQQEPGTGGEASFISSAAVEQVRDLAASSGVIQSLVESWEACSSSNSYCYKPKGTGDIKGCNPNISKEEEKPPRGTDWGPARGFQQTALPETWLESEAAAWISLGPSGGLCPLNPGQCSHHSIHQLCGTYQLFPRW
ncbi:uncharacterized protein LOC125133187 [Phacochoerus africanus]|uniref:uncharacterized protein LOC125133187 n=1 Tax=Phacochoerus africanus TaxID=41426 RepID=UPI001FD93281|nr:uncharacterized protein LOC125133187 [Phacochoerus africanus]